MDKQNLISWCLARQSTGFQGRPNKKTDTCYCFWIGGALQVRLAQSGNKVSPMIESIVSRVNVYLQNLGAFELVNEENLRSFLMCTQTIRGGFGKDEESSPGQFSASVIRTMGGQANSHTAHLPRRRTTLLHGTRYTVLDERTRPYKVGRCPQYTNCCCQSLAQTSRSPINRNAF